MINVRDLGFGYQWYLAMDGNSTSSFNCQSAYLGDLVGIFIDLRVCVVSRIGFGGRE